MDATDFARGRSARSAVVVDNFRTGATQPPSPCRGGPTVLLCVGSYEVDLRLRVRSAVRAGSVLAPGDTEDWTVVASLRAPGAPV